MQPKDPFADIANLASGLNINFNPTSLGGKSTGHTPVGNSPFTTQFSSPTHNTASNNIRVPPTQTSTTASSTTSPNHTKSPNNASAFGGPAFASAQGASAQQTNTSARPDYSRTHFEPPKSTSNAQQSKSSDIFADILGEQGYKFTSKTQHGPRSINEMRKEDLIKDMDPKKVKIMEWVSCLK